PDPIRPLAPAEADAAFAAIMDGKVDDGALAAFLLGLARRGETAEEIAAAARALRARMLGVAAPAGAIDVCGTGGDGSHSLNVSTAVAFVVAACGVPVAKHGNRAASSRCGTADVLEALGADLSMPFDRIEAMLQTVGIAFLFAQRHHPAMSRVAAVRRALAKRTIFNLLGPLANPAGVRRQLIGVFAADWLARMAEAGCMLGAEALLLVHGAGLDEIAPDAESQLLWMREGKLREASFSPQAHGMPAVPRAAIAGGDAAYNALMLNALLAGKQESETLSAYRAMVVLNAAAALKLAGAAPGWAAAIGKAQEAIDSGAAADRLAHFLSFR
ncbi:anthranilate phosphoribosyltransferase, partial [Thermaurantiacus sp.]